MFFIYVHSNKHEKKQSFCKNIPVKGVSNFWLEACCCWQWRCLSVTHWCISGTNFRCRNLSSLLLCSIHGSNCNTEPLHCYQKSETDAKKSVLMSILVIFSTKVKEKEKRGGAHASTDPSYSSFLWFDSTVQWYHRPGSWISPLMLLDMHGVPLTGRHVFFNLSSICSASSIILWNSLSFLCKYVQNCAKSEQSVCKIDRWNVVFQ